MAWLLTDAGLPELVALRLSGWAERANASRQPNSGSVSSINTGGVEKSDDALTFRGRAVKIHLSRIPSIISQESTMAQKVQVILVDDVDGGEADETVSFALDGVSYEIDVSAVNAEAIRDALAPWVGHARRVGGRTGARARAGARPRPAAERTDLSDVRAWARENGYQVSDRGRVSSEVRAAYEAAH
jgi:hypothetical protein